MMHYWIRDRQSETLSSYGQNFGFLIIIINLEEPQWHLRMAMIPAHLVKEVDYDALLDLRQAIVQRLPEIRLFSVRVSHRRRGRRRGTVKVHWPGQLEVRGPVGRAPCRWLATSESGPALARPQLKIMSPPSAKFFQVTLSR